MAYVLLDGTSVSEIELEERANQVMINFSNEESSRGLGSIKRILKDVTKLNEVDGISLLSYNYADENGDSSGYVLIADDERFGVPFAISSSNNMYGETDNPGMEIFFSRVEDYMKNVIDDYSNISQETIDAVELKINEIKSNNNALSRNTTPGNYRFTKEVDPLLITQWDQEEPYNDFAPFMDDGVTRSYAGCVAIAMAQILYYHEFPDNFTYNHYDPSIDPELYDYYDSGYISPTPIPVTINWAELGGKSFFIEPSNIFDPIKQLIRECANEVEMKWLNEKGSSATTQAVPDALRSFGYTSDEPVETNTTTIWDDLDSGLPIIMRGRHAKLNDDGDVIKSGHMWVVDGYVIRSWDLILDGTSIVVQTFNNYYVHCNWGWGRPGNKDWYLYGVFDSSEGLYKYQVEDDVRNIEADPGNYKYDLETIKGIEPQ